ncbi:putative GTPase activating protein for Arf-domain-containing protein, partial [Chytridium lagenaria]
MATRTERFADKSLNDRHQDLKELCNVQTVVANCRKKDPRMGELEFRPIVCIRCSGTHRSMGSISQRFALTLKLQLDTWTPEQIQSMVKWGNAKANAYWEHD